MNLVYKTDKLFLVGTLLAMAVSIGGCGGSGLPTLYPAKGVVTYKGAPVAGAQVTFNSESNPMCTAMTDAKGEFTLKTNGEPGVAAGQYLVSIIKMEGGPQTSGATPEDMIKLKGNRGQILEMPKNALPVKYADFRQSELTADVKSDESQNVFTFDLKD